MKVTLRELADSIPAFNELMEVPMPMSTAYKIKEMAKEAEGHTTTMYETMQEKREEYTGDPDLKTEIPDGKAEEWDEEMGELLDTEVEMRSKRIDPVDLGLAPVKPITLWALDWVFTSPKSEPESD